MAVNVGILQATLRLSTDKFKRSADAAVRDMTAMGGRMERVGQSLTRTGATMTIGLTTPLLAIASASLMASVNAEETANKFRVVFGAGVDAANKKLLELTSTIPLTVSEMQAMAAGIQDMLVPMGVAREKAAGMSVDMVQLAGDLGSFQNVGTDVVLAAITSALAGSSEPMRRYGVDTRTAALEAVALKNGLIELGEKLTNTTRAQAVLLAVQQDSSDAMGDAAATVESTANQMKFLARDARQLSETIGDVLVPMIRPLILKLGEWVKWMTELDPSTQKIVVAVGLLVAGIGPLLFVLGSFATAMVGLTGVMVTNTAAVATNAAALGGHATASGVAAAATGKLSLSLIGKVGLVGAAAAAGVAVGTLVNWLIGTDALANALYGSANAATTAGTALRGFQGEADRLAPSIDAVNALAEEFRDTIPEITAAIRENVVEGVAYDKILLGLMNRFKEGTVEGDALMGALMDISRANTEVAITAMEAARGLDDEAKAVTKLDEQTLIVIPSMTNLNFWAMTLNKSTKTWGSTVGWTATQSNLFHMELGRLEDAQRETEKATRAAALALDEFGNSARQTADSFHGFFQKLLGGIPIIGSLSGALGKGIDKLAEWTGQLKDKLTSGLSSLFGADSKIGNFLSEGLGAAIGFAIPLLGPMIAPLIGKLTGILMKGLGAMWGKVKGIFGGPGADELGARKTVDAINDAMIALLGTQANLEAGGIRWKEQNVAQRDVILALGGTVAEVEAIWKRFTDSQKDQSSADKFAEFWKIKLDEIQAKMAETGMTLQELRDTAMAGAQASATAQVESATKAAEAMVDTMRGAADTINDTFRSMRFDIPVNFDVAGFPKGFGDSAARSRATSESGIESFAHGGIVPGPIGTPQLVIAHSGERFIPPGGGGGDGDRDFKALLVEIQTLSAALRRAEDVREVTQRDRSLMGM